MGAPTPGKKPTTRPPFWRGNFEGGEERVKAIREKPARRFPVWLGTMALILSVLALSLTPAHAQTQQVLKVIIGDFVNRDNGQTNDPIAKQATAAVYNELTTSGQGRFDVFPSSSVLAEARAEGIQVPSNPNVPAAFSTPELLRLAKQLTADAILQGTVSVARPGRGRPATAIISMTLMDVASQDTINGGVGQGTATPRPGQTADAEDLVTQAIENAAQAATSQVIQRQLPVATVMGVNPDYVILNRGVRDGIHEGDNLVIERIGANGQITREGMVRVARVYPSDSEADIIDNTGGVRPEDIGRVLYRAPVVVLPNAKTQPSTVRSRVNFSAIGATLTAIGLGVLLSQASHGGQVSVSDVTAEAYTTDNVSSAARVTWNNNVFGQGGVQEYHIWRLPDHGFTLNVGNLNGGGGAGNGNNGGTGVVFSSAPIGLSFSTTRQFIDHPTPFAFYLNGVTITIGNGNGGFGTNNGNQNGGNGGNVSCTYASLASPLPTGFIPGTTYQYQVSAVIQRLNSTNTTSGGAGGGGNFYICIETDPATSSNVTPVNPAPITFPGAQATAINITSFQPTWLSEAGADTFQVEVSTDRNFSNPNNILRIGPIFSTAPTSGNVPQTISTPVNLATAAPLLNDPNFANFVKGTTSTAPTIYVRVGDRHDSDQPGPVDWFSKNPGDSDRTWRWVYDQPVAFQPAPIPPGTPGGTAAARLNKAMAANHALIAPLKVPGDTVTGRAGRNHLPTITDILLGKARGRH